MKTIHLNHLLLILALFLFSSCVESPEKENINETYQRADQRTPNTTSVVEVCQNCHVTFKTSLISQKMAMKSGTAHLCEKCALEHYKEKINEK